MYTLKTSIRELDLNGLTSSVQTAKKISCAKKKGIRIE